MNDEEKLMSVARGLLARTTAGELAITWKETANDKAFQTSREENTIVTVFPYSTTVGLQILNKSGRVIQEIIVDPKSPNGIVLQEIYKLARRQALRVDETLDKLVRELGA